MPSSGRLAERLLRGTARGRPRSLHACRDERLTEQVTEAHLASKRRYGPDPRGIRVGVAHEDVEVCFQVRSPSVTPISDREVPIKPLDLTGW